jgi:WD40 repeat protein
MGQNNGHNGYGQIAFPAHSNVFGAANGAGVSLFNLETGRESDMLAVPEVGMAWPLAMSPDSTLVASVSGKTGSGINPPGSLIVWNLKSKNAPEIIGALESEVRKLAFSHDGKLLIGCDKGGSIRLWDLATKKLVGQHHAHEGWANGIAFSPDDKLVVSGGDDGFVRVWSVAELMNERPN